MLGPRAKLVSELLTTNRPPTYSGSCKELHTQAESDASLRQGVCFVQGRYGGTAGLRRRNCKGSSLELSVLAAEPNEVKGREGN